MYHYDKTSGLFTGLKQLPSDNYDQRPAATDISLIVIHNISLPPGQFGGEHIERFFTNRLYCNEHEYCQQLREVRVSPHLLISRQGEITQFVSCLNRAWHAGNSAFQGVANCNDYSIGIELEGTDNTPYEVIQYQHLVKICQALMIAYPQITQQRIVGHVHIAPERKTDPGPAFAWDFFQHRIKDED